jgi:hypothetical protein
MPVQETFFNQRIGNERFKIIKTYDPSLAREAFADMDSAALDHLADSLTIEQRYEPHEIPNPPVDAPDFLWDELCESAREEGQKCSFFVVTRASKTGRSFLYVSGDWPSAEGFVRGLFPA